MEQKAAAGRKAKAVAALAPMAPPQSEVRRVISESDALAADRAANVNKAERAIEREAERALDLQIKHQNLPGAWA